MTWRGRALAGALAVLALGGPASAQPGATLVVPFELERFDARVAWLSEGVAVGLTAALRDRGVPVISRDARLGALERLQLPPGAALTRATVVQVAELVGASRVVMGRVSAGGAAIAIEGRVLDVASAELADPFSDNAPVAALLDGFARLAAAVDGGGEVRAGAAAAVAPSVPAFELLVRGLVAPTTALQERYLRQSLGMAPRYLAVRQALWEVLTATGAHERALAALGDTAGDSGAARDLRVRRASTLTQLRRYDDAYAALIALDAGDRDAVVANMLGVVQLRRGAPPQTGRATYYFNQAVERDALDPDYCFNLGYSYWQDKDALAAAYWLREAVRRNPADGDAHFVLAAALAASGAEPEAERERELARRLSARWESASPGEAVPMGLERAKERARIATSALETALAAAGARRDQREAAAFHVEAARRAYEGGRDPEAIREVQRALYLTPYDAEALLLLGRAQARSGLLQEAIGTLKIAIWSAESAAAHVELGAVLLRTRDAAGALRAAERALVLEPQHGAAADLAARARAARAHGPA